MRKHELLSEAERELLFRIPVDRNTLARLYTFEMGDLKLIWDRREDRNRLGVALQLALLRHPGMSLAQVLHRSVGLPNELVIFVAEQLEIPASVLADYAVREQTMTDHARELATALGLRPAARTDIPFMIDAAAKAAWSTDKGVDIAAGIISALRDAKILLPAISTIERTGIAGRARARKQAAQALLSGFSPEQLKALDALLIDETGTGTIPLTWLKAIPAAAKPDHVRSILDRLRTIREMNISAKLSTAIHPDRYRQFVQEARISPAYMIVRYTVSRRRATLVALLIDLEERLTDAAIEMADKLLRGMFSRAQNKQSRRYVGTAKDVARLMRLFHGTIDALSTAHLNDSDPIELIDEAVGWANLLKARHEVAALAETADVDPLVTAVDRYATLRKFAPALIEALEFMAGRGSAKTIAAVQTLRDLNKSGKRTVPPDAPMPFKKDWRKLVTEADGKVNHLRPEAGGVVLVRNVIPSSA